MVQVLADLKAGQMVDRKALHWGGRWVALKVVHLAACSADLMVGQMVSL